MLLLLNQIVEKNQNHLEEKFLIVKSILKIIFIFCLHIPVPVWKVLDAEDQENLIKSVWKCGLQLVNILMRLKKD